ncbi:MAG: CRISPR-associated endonuclease Cas1 [bacterium]
MGFLELRAFVVVGKAGHDIASRQTIALAHRALDDGASDLAADGDARWGLDAAGGDDIGEQRVGFDAWRGFLHQPRHGRPALALDLMEEFRPILADSAVITAINTGAVGVDDFLIHPTGVAFSEKGRKAFLMVWQRRLDELATHPVTGTRVSMLRMIEVHVRLFARFLYGELPAPPSWTPR